MSYRFHVNLFGQPFDCTWEEAAAALQALPRMVFEPDGSWIWSGGARETRWQIDGHLFDFQERLHRVELHGSCSQGAFDQLLACFGWPSVQLTFELIREGVQVNESDFRQRASIK